MAGKTLPAMSSPALRRAFLDYFQGREHAIVPRTAIVSAPRIDVLPTTSCMLPVRRVNRGATPAWLTVHESTATATFAVSEVGA